MAVTSSPPKPRSFVGQQQGDRRFILGLGTTSILPILLLLGLIVLLTVYAWPSITRYGLSFLISSDWDPVFEQFGALPFIYGTIVTSIIALLLATPLAVGAAIFVSEFAPKRIGAIIAFLIELLVAIPSVAYGIWGIFVLVPIMRDTVGPALKATLGKLPGLNVLFPPNAVSIGYDMLTAGVLLSVMVLPTILSIAREIIAQVPRLQKEGMLALGATHWEMVRGAILPYARAGIVGAIMLGLARAIGETMAVTMVIGNSSNEITGSLFTPGYTIASAIANQFNEADKDIYFSAIVQLGLVLLLIASVFNIAARLLVNRLTRMPGGGKA